MSCSKQCQETCVRFAVVLFSGEHAVRAREQLQRTLAAAFFVAAAKMVGLLPRCRLYDGQWNLATREHCLERADRTAVLEAGDAPCFGIA
jgi:hypothetical protein